MGYNSHRELKFRKAYNYFHIEVFLGYYHVMSVTYDRPETLKIPRGTGWIAILGLLAVVVFGPGSTSKKAFNNARWRTGWLGCNKPPLRAGRCG
jgi:hypothetical protein